MLLLVPRLQYRPKQKQIGWTPNSYKKTRSQFKICWGTGGGSELERGSAAKDDDLLQASIQLFCIFHFCILHNAFLHFAFFAFCKRQSSFLHFALLYFALFAFCKHQSSLAERFRWKDEGHSHIHYVNHFLCILFFPSHNHMHTVSSGCIFMDYQSLISSYDTVSGWV